MAKKQALGRGMEAIFLDNTPEAAERVDRLPLSSLEPRRGQPRKSFNTEALSQLADSISANGLIQPIIVRAVDGSEYYQIIAGERRWRAARMAGLSEVPVVVVEADDRKAAEYALIENIQREDLSPIEEAQGFKTLISDYELTQEQAAKRVGRSRAAVTNALRLLELPENILKLIDNKALTAGHARALLGLNDKSQLRDAAALIIKDDMSVRAAEELVKKLNSAKSAAPEEKNEVEESYYSSLEQRLSDALGCKVRISHSKRRRALSIAYKTNDELEELLRRLGLDASDE